MTLQLTDMENESEMPAIDYARKCPACNCSRAKSMGKKGGFEWLNCRACDTLYVAMLPTEESRMKYETGGYYNDENLTVPEFITRRLEEIVESFAPYRLTNKLLDIGCGAGSLLMAAKKAGWEAEGVEVSHPTVEHLRNNGLKVFSGDLKEAAFPTGNFDVVTAAELIEHVSDPSSLVEEIGRILRPGGVFWATSPHAKGASARVLKLKWSTVSPPEHLHLFSTGGLRKLLMSHGFRHVEVKTEGLSISELLGVIRGREQNAAEISAKDGHNRVASDYRLNEKLMSNPRRKVMKRAVNAVLRGSRLGDSLKVWAER
jgi:2-polyprenyl-3-methyl-5-hydroxy-6-metoxy-1,4-benzoquinol methylase